MFEEEEYLSPEDEQEEAAHQVFIFACSVYAGLELYFRNKDV